jgi:hypothetical protein
LELPGGPRNLRLLCKMQYNLPDQALRPQRLAVHLNRFRESR